MLSVTYLAIYHEEVIGYFTLSTDNIKLSNLEENYKDKFEDKDIYYKVFPAVKLGRFAIDKKCQNKGVGRFLFERILYISVMASKQIGFRFISIDAYGDAYNFYKKMKCKDTLKKKKLENKLNEFEKANLQNKYNITIRLSLDLYLHNPQ